MGDGKREIIAYAITHAPRGVKGGPYEGSGGYGVAAASLDDAARWRGGRPRKWTMRNIRKVIPHARVIRIVRKGPSADLDAARELSIGYARRMRAATQKLVERFGADGPRSLEDMVAVACSQAKEWQTATTRILTAERDEARRLRKEAEAALAAHGAWHPTKDGAGS